MRSSRKWTTGQKGNLVSRAPRRGRKSAEGLPGVPLFGAPPPSVPPPHDLLWIEAGAIIITLFFSG